LLFFLHIKAEIISITLLTDYQDKKFSDRITVLSVTKLSRFCKQFF